MGKYVQSFLIIVLACILLLASGRIANAQTPLQLEPGKDDYSLDNHIGFFYVDKDLSIKDIDQKYRDKFSGDANRYKRINDSYHWLTFTIKNNANIDRTIFIKTSIFPHRVGIWNLYTEVKPHTFTQESFPKYRSQIFFFSVTVPAHSERTYFMERYLKGFTFLKFGLADPQAFTLQAVDFYFLLGFLYGIPIALLLHSLVIFLFTKDNTYLFYILFVASCVITLAFKDGIINRFLEFPIDELLYNNFIRVGVFLSAVFYMLFAQRILSLKFYMPKFNQLFNILILFCFPFAIIFGFLFLSENIIIITIIEAFPLWYFLIVDILIFIASIVVTLKGFQPAKYYLAGISALMCGYVLLILQERGFIQLYPFFHQSAQWGLAIDHILQAIALAARYNLLQESEINAQKEIINQKDINVFLQKKSLREKETLINAYARFFPHRFLELLRKKNVIDIKLGDHVERTMTVLFADLRNFTSLLEKMTPFEGIQFINSYLSQIGPVIRENSGVIDKYVGDAILAFFDKNNKKPINSAIEITRIINELRKNHAMHGFLEMGIGIHYGPLMVGTIGETFRMDGTIISDTVNTASRIQALNLIYGTQIIITEEVAQTIKDDFTYQLRFLDKLLVKGKKSEIKIYEVFNTNPPHLIRKKLAIQLFYAEAIEQYHQGKMKVALPLFEKCHAIMPEDKAIRLYISRCQKLIHDGWPEGHSPIYQFVETFEIREKKTE